MTISIYLIRILVSIGVGVRLMFTLAAWVGILNVKPSIGKGPYVLFCIFSIITMVFACLLWRIK